MTIWQAILNLKAIQFARLSAAQEDANSPIVTIDDEANTAIEIAIRELEKKGK